MLQVVRYGDAIVRSGMMGGPMFIGPPGALRCDTARRVAESGCAGRSAAVELLMTLSLMNNEEAPPMPARLWRGHRRGPMRCLAWRRGAVQGVTTRRAALRCGA